MQVNFGGIETNETCICFVPSYERPVPFGGVSFFSAASDERKCHWQVEMYYALAVEVVLHIRSRYRRVGCNIKSCAVTKQESEKDIIILYCFLALTMFSLSILCKKKWTIQTIRYTFLIKIQNFYHSKSYIIWNLNLLHFQYVKRIQTVWKRQ